MRTLVLLGLFLSIPLSGGVIKVADLPKFWADSGMSADMVRAQISNAKCFQSDEYTQACRLAMLEGKKTLLQNGLPFVEDEFDATIDDLDHLQSNSYSKEWVLGQMYNTFLHAFDAHAVLMPQAIFDSLYGR